MIKQKTELNVTYLVINTIHYYHNLFYKISMDIGVLYTSDYQPGLHYVGTTSEVF